MATDEGMEVDAQIAETEELSEEPKEEPKPKKKKKKKSMS